MALQEGCTPLPTTSVGPRRTSIRGRLLFIAVAAVTGLVAAFLTRRPGTAVATWDLQRQLGGGPAPVETVVADAAPVQTVVVDAVPVETVVADPAPVKTVVAGRDAGDGFFVPKRKLSWPARRSMQVSSEPWMGPNSLPGTTGPGVPALIRQVLKERYGGVDEDAQDHFGAQEAVLRAQDDCGWDPLTSNFTQGAACFADKIGGFELSRSTEDVGAVMKDVDIVVPSIRDLDFLEQWRDAFEGVHIIIIQDGDPKKVLKVPEWVDYELYNRDDIDKALGDRAWIISSKDASIRNFGFLVSQKEFVYTLDDDCLPALNPHAKSSVQQVNALREHMLNLKRPSTPYFHNTLYDPYRQGSDFVRGYPYSLRGGVPTAISHGLWLNAPDYDAPTQLLKPRERNERYVDAAVTVPAGVLYPMCSMNVAFNRRLIGPAFMQGLMGDGQPWARYDDMFAGWASKVVADHLGLGTKSGAPYIHHNKASNPFTNLQKEYKGLFWQEEVISFFVNKVKFADDITTPDAAYKDLARQIREHLLPVHGYFGRLSMAMELWVDVWRERQEGKLNIQPSRVSKPPAEHGDVAVLTVTRNEEVWLPLWIRHYRKTFGAKNMYILDNDSDDGSTDGLWPISVKKIQSDGYFNHGWLVQQVKQATQSLLDMGYSAVLFTEADELVVADPEKYPGGLQEYLQKFKASDKITTRVNGFHIVQHFKAKEPELRPLDFNKPIAVSQRRYWIPGGIYCKPLLTKRTLEWTNGFHTCDKCEDVKVDEDLYMFHMKRADHNYLAMKQEWKARQSFHNDGPHVGVHHHWLGEKFEEWFMEDQKHLAEIPARFKDLF